MEIEDPISISDIAEEAEKLDGEVLSAPLVGYDKDGELRYITAWDVHTTGDGSDEEDCFGSTVTSARIVFKFGDIANI